MRITFLNYILWIKNSSQNMRPKKNTTHMRNIWFIPSPPHRTYSGTSLKANDYV